MNWQLTSDPLDHRQSRWRNLPTPAAIRLHGPEAYLADASLIDVLNTALYLGQPLLVTGEPGCGKTALADYLAWKLGLERSNAVDAQRDGSTHEYALRFDIKSETRARDLFYTLDVVERFHAAQQAGGNIDPLRFMTFQAFGRAILYANHPGDLSARLPPQHAHPGEPRRSVVLIDEIDKAPRDVPNDLLMEMDRMRFFVPELNYTVSAPAGMLPIVIITSNSERVLPDAFLRRCLYYHIPFPDPDRLKEIVASRLEDLPRVADLLNDAIAVFAFARRRATGKVPGLTELLGFLLALRSIGYKPNDTLRERDDWRPQARVTLFKTAEDQAESLEGFAWAETSN